MLVEHQNIVSYCGECRSEQHGMLACRSLISLSNNCVLRMLLRMLSACAPGIGYLINPIACSGQDQDPSNETIVAQHPSGKAARSIERVLVNAAGTRLFAPRV